VAATLAIVALSAIILAALYKLPPSAAAAITAMAVLVAVAYIIRARRWDRNIKELHNARASLKEKNKT
jgi:hypothetical protein